MSVGIDGEVPESPGDELVYAGSADVAPPLVMARSQGMVSCHHCAAVWRGAASGDICGRCGTQLHSRKLQSLQRTWALLIAACVMYLPANLLPVMVTRNLFGSESNTILSGVILFWKGGSYGVAAIIFIASFIVPLFKLVVLTLLVVTAQWGSTWRQHDRAGLYHLIEFIGRWSMLDVFVVALLTGLVQIRGFAEIEAGIGIAAFGAVVVLTMLASLSFDPRLIWDPSDPDATPAGVITPNDKDIDA